VVAALGANAVIAVTKFAAALVTGSAALLAEAFHSTADTGNQALLLLGLERAGARPDREHPFGHGKERFFWPFVVAVGMFAVGASFSVYEGVTRLFSGGGLEISLGVALGVLGVVALFESYAWQKAYRSLRPSKGRRSWWQVVRGTKQPELLTVLLEDSAALLGIALAASGIVLAHVTGRPAFDAAGAIAVGLLLGVVAFVLGRESQALLVGEAATEPDLRAMEQAIAGVPAARALHDLRTMHLAPDRILVAARVVLEPRLDTAGVAEACAQIEAAIRGRVPAAEPVLVEVARNGGVHPPREGAERG
jgi:cation diffusion facilitator family transporter